jgi:hypothetical protein
MKTQPKKQTDSSFNTDLIELGLVATITVCLIIRILQLT